MFKKKKRVFWEALLITIIVFVGGLILGISIEGRRIDKIDEYYLESEISLMDIFVLNSLTNSPNNCEKASETVFSLADRIYEEAQILNDYESSGKISDTIKLQHRRYDLMRTLLWETSMKIKKECDSNYSVVVYLYNYNPEDLVEKATNNVWSKVLMDLKSQEGNRVLLIPIANDSEIISLNSKLSNFNITDYPVIIVNEEHVITDLNSIQELESYLD